MNAITKELETCRQDLAICRGHEKFMNDIMKHFNDYLFFHDMDGNFLDYNPAHQKDSDYSRNDMQQMNIKDLSSPKPINMKSQITSSASGKPTLTAATSTYSTGAGSQWSWST